MSKRLLWVSVQKIDGLGFFVGLRAKVVRNSVNASLRVRMMKSAL
jgi:hypothetical protein